MRKLAIATVVVMINLIGPLCFAAASTADPEFPDIDSLPMASIKYPAGFDPVDGNSGQSRTSSRLPTGCTAGYVCRRGEPSKCHPQMSPARVSCLNAQRREHRPY